MQLVYKKCRLVSIALILNALLFVCGLTDAGALTPMGSELSWHQYESLLSAHDVIWNQPGHGAVDSMPLGNGDIGLNLWTEENGSLDFYLSKSDAWSEEPNGALGLMKYGGVRVCISGKRSWNPKSFQQKLHLAQAEIEVNDEEVHVVVWVEAEHPVVHVSVQSVDPVTVQVSLLNWRTEKTGKISPDIVLPHKEGEIVWYHQDSAEGDPNLTGQSFGATIKGPGMKGEGRELVSSQAVRSHEILVFPLTVKAGQGTNWVDAEEQLVVQEEKRLRQSDAWSDHLKWWQKFWQRGWILIDGDRDAASVTSGYILQRFISASAGRGAHAIKFNGSLFVVDNPSVLLGNDTNKQPIYGAVTADYRGWGGRYWFQNTRPIYWPMLAQGDFDMMLPLFRQYREMLDSNRKQVHEYYHHDGAYFAETSPFWGGLRYLPPDKPGAYTDFYFTPILELSMMMLDYYEYTRDEQFARDTMMPVATQGITFFDQHFGRDADGKLLLDPDNSIEMFWKVHDPAPDIAGLQALLRRLSGLPENLSTLEQRVQWKRLAAELPPLPSGNKNGREVLLPYSGPQNQSPHNSENPELYAIYPFRLYGVHKPGLEIARNTFASRSIQTTGCWVQDPVQAAYLGLSTIAKNDVIFNFNRKDPHLKFPAFWDKGHDYAPDEDNGGNAQLALQKMLMQSDEGKIWLLPAWPTEWNADFKLHAPDNTTVEGRVENGKIVRLVVMPESRMKDVVLPEGVTK